MDLHERQQFDFLLNTAVERYVERLEQRNGGVENALARLRNDPEAEDIWLSRFAQAVFDDFLLNNVEGSCFVLKALPKRSVGPLEGGQVEVTLQAMAHRAFGDLLCQKTIEALEQRSSFEALPIGEESK